MLALLALLGSAAHLAAAGPPPASVATGAAPVPLGITAWCWDTRCGAPLTSTGRRVVVARGATVRIELRSAPLEAALSVGGTPTHTVLHGHEVRWTATRAGGLTLRVTYPHGWVIYSARLALR